MPRNVPWSSIPKPKPPGLPPRAYIFEIEKMEEDNYEGRFTVNTTYRVEEPPSMKGRLHFQTYYIGTDEDPEANDPQTYIASKDFQALTEALKQSGLIIKEDEKLEKAIARAVGRKVGLVIGEYTVKPTRKDGTPNANPGDVKTVIRKAFKYGELPVTEDGAAPKPKVAPVVARPAAAVAPKATAPAPAEAAEPEEGDDDYED